MVIADLLERSIRFAFLLMRSCFGLAVVKEQCLNPEVCYVAQAEIR